MVGLMGRAAHQPDHHIPQKARVQRARRLCRRSRGRVPTTFEKTPLNGKKVLDRSHHVRYNGPIDQPKDIAMS